MESRLFTAVVTGVQDKNVAWTASCGTVINGLHNTIGLKSGSQQTCNVTATSAADKTKAATGVVTFIAAPHFQEGVHPRLLLTPAMVNTMRTGGWATSKNPYWVNGLSKSAANAITEVDAKWCFSFGGNCAAGTKPGFPVHAYDPNLYYPPAVKSLERDSSATVTVTTAGPFNVWKGATLLVSPAAGTTNDFKKGTVTVASVLDATHFTYKDSGRPASTSSISVSFNCGKMNTDTWCDTGQYKSPIFDATESYTELFAFLSLIDPNPTNQAHYRIRAHDMMMWMINQAADTTSQTCKPAGHFFSFTNCYFPTNDRAHQVGSEPFPLTVDWIYSSFTSAEKKSITHVFRWWANQAITTGPTGIPYPLPFGVMNNPILLANTKALRWQMNNLADSQYRTTTMLSLAMDAEDDPPDDGNPANRLAVAQGKDGPRVNSLRGYCALAAGAWTYIHWAVAEDPGVVSKVLGVSPEGLGEEQGGLSPEGSEYGPNYGYVALASMAFHTAGADDPAVMPQLSFLESSHWDLWIDGLLNVISPATRNEKSGSFHETTKFGDDSTPDEVTAGYITLLMSLGLHDYYGGTNPARLNAIRWIARNAVGAGCGSGPDGACGNSSQYLYKRLISTLGSNNFATPIYFFLLLDPAATATSATNPSGEADPHSHYPPEFYAAGHHEMSVRIDWKPDASWLVSHCSWIGIDHQRGDCGQTEFYRKGRWLTRAHATYINIVGGLAMFSNSGITIGNPSNNPSKDDFYAVVAAHGAQYDGRGADGFTPHPRVSSAPSFLYEYVDQTESFNENRANHFPTSDVLYASRSVLWLKPDILIYYDRGMSRSAGMFKRDSFNFLAKPALGVQTMTVVDPPSRQQVFLTSVLPEAPNFSASVCAYGTVDGDCAGGDAGRGEDASTFLYQITDKSAPKSAQFLSVMEGADAGASRTPVALLQASGTPLDGVLVGSSAVLFVRPPPHDNAFTSSSYSVPSSAQHHYLGGLKPSVKYRVEARIVGTRLNVSVSSNCAQNCIATDEAGLLAYSINSTGVVTGIQ